jgi:hypothetical protein
MKTEVQQSEATMCGKRGFVARLSRIFFISNHSSSHDFGSKATWQIFCLCMESAT